MKAKQLREMTQDELEISLEDLEKRLFDLRSQAVTEKLEDPSMLTKAKRDMARLLTLQRERRAPAPAPNQGKA